MLPFFYLSPFSKYHIYFLKRDWYVEKKSNLKIKTDIHGSDENNELQFYFNGKDPWTKIKNIGFGWV